MRFGKPTKNKRRHNPRYHTLSEGANIENNSNKNLHDVQFYLEEFYPFCKKALGFEQDAAIVFESDYKNAKDPLGKTAYYDPSAASISVYVDARHPKDIMRSVAHELVHHHQNVRGDLQGTSMEEGYAQNDEHLREMEREAYEKGNLLFRDWEDHKKGGGDESLMARIMEKWGYNSAALTEGAADFEEGQLVTVIGSALAVDGEKKGTVISFEDPAVTIQLDDDQEGKHVPDDKKVKVKKDYVEARVESGFAPEMGASEEETLEEYDGDEFDMESLEREFPWLSKSVKAGEVPADVAAELADEFGSGEEEEVVMKEADVPWTPEELFAHLEKYPSGVTANDLKYAFGGSPQAHAAALQALTNQGELVYDNGKYTLADTEATMKEAAVGNIEVGDDVDVLGGGLTGASGKVIELTKTTEGADAVVIELTKDADKPVMGKAGDEVIAKYEDIELADLPGDKRPKPGESSLYDLHYTEAIAMKEASGDFVALAAEYAGEELAAVEGFEDHMLHFQKQGRTPEEAADRWDTLNAEEEPYDWDPRKDPLSEYGDHDTQAAGGLVQAVHSSDAELTQVADIVRDVVGKGGGLHDLKKPLEAEGFDVQATSQFVMVKTPEGTIAIASANNVELSGDEELIDTKYGQLAVGRINQGMEETVEPDTSQMNNKEFFDYVQEKYGAVPIGGEDPTKFPNREAEGLEGPFKYGTGHILYYDQREGKYYNPETDLYIEDSEMEKIMNKSVKEGEDDMKLKKPGVETSPIKQDGNEMNLEEVVRQAVRKALKEKKYRREDEEEETVSEELSDKQKELDLDDDGKIEPEDLKGLRAGKEDEDVGEEKEEKNEGKLPPWLEKKEGKEDDDKEVVEEDDDDEKNESLDTKDWWDNSLYERLTKKWTK